MAASRSSARRRRHPAQVRIPLFSVASGKLANPAPALLPWLVAQRDLPAPLCFDCVHYPDPPEDLEESAPDRTTGRSLTAEFLCPQIRRRVLPAYAARCGEYQEAAAEDEAG
jgi:hypothetical protein